MQKELAMMISGTLLFGVLLVTLPKNMGFRAAQTDGAGHAAAKTSPSSETVSTGARRELQEREEGTLSEDTSEDTSETSTAPSPVSGGASVNPTGETGARLPLNERSYLATVAAPDVWPIRDWNILPPRLAASSSIVMLADSEKILFEHNGAEEMPIASIMKLLTVLTALERGDPQMVIEISKEAIGEGRTWFSAGEHFTLGQLFLFMLLPSSNEAAKQVWLSFGGEDFSAAMNAKARALGMKNSSFANGSGLHDPRHRSTARDVALLLKAVLDQEFLVRSMALQTVTVSSGEGREIMIQNSNKLLGKVPRLVLGKTGFTNESRETLAAVTEEGEGRQKVVFVVLGSDDRFADMQKLIEWTRKAYKF